LDLSSKVHTTIYYNGSAKFMEGFEMDADHVNQLLEAVEARALSFGWAKRLSGCCWIKNGETHSYLFNEINALELDTILDWEKRIYRAKS
jgi:hypothetical protein